MKWEIVNGRPTLVRDLVAESGAKIIPFRRRDEAPEPVEEVPQVWLDGNVGMVPVVDLTERVERDDKCVWNIKLRCWQLD